MAQNLRRKVHRQDHYQCDLQIMDIKNRFFDPERFKSWVYAVSGCSISMGDVEL